MDFDNLTEDNILVLDSPILTNSQLKVFKKIFSKKIKEIDCTFDINSSLKNRIEAIRTECETAVREGSTTLILSDKKYLLTINTKVLDGRIFLTGKVEDPEEKLKITKMAWETKGVRSVRNNVIIKEEFNFKQSATDLLITSQLRTALILNKNIKSTNYNIDTYKKKIYIYGIAQTKDEQKEVLKEGKAIPDVERVVASILLVEDLNEPPLLENFPVCFSIITEFFP